MAINFSLPALNVSATQSINGLLNQSYSDSPIGTCDAGVDINISIDYFTNLFQIQFWDDILSDYPVNAVRYYIEDAAIAALNSAVGSLFGKQVTLNPITTTLRDGGTMDPDQLVTYNTISNDFVRYLGVYIFGYHSATDFFTNEAELVIDINTQIDTQYANSFTTSLSNFSMSSTLSTYSDNNGFHYFTDEDNISANICREIFLRMMSQDPSRFTSLSSTTDLQPLPFVAGDKILYKLTLNAAAGQTLYGDPDGVRSGTRTYNINLILTA